MSAPRAPVPKPRCPRRAGAQDGGGGGGAGGAERGRLGAGHRRGAAGCPAAAALHRRLHRQDLHEELPVSVLRLSRQSRDRGCGEGRCGGCGGRWGGGCGAVRGRRRRPGPGRWAPSPLGENIHACLNVYLCIYSFIWSCCGGFVLMGSGQPCRLLSLASGAGPAAPRPAQPRTPPL